MADETQIISALHKLTTYYGRGPTQAQLQFYLEMLSELEPAALDYAVNSWIRSSPFFPRINELLQAAGRYTPPPAPPTRALLQIQWSLEWEFFHEGTLKLEAWERLAHSFELNNRLYSANACRKRARCYQEMLNSRKDPQK